MVRNSDRIIGSAIAAGYTSISRYVPYSMWQTNVSLPPDRQEFDITKNMEMIKGIKCFIRHGVEDDNVPIYHSRLLASLDPAITLEEMVGKGHWYDGVLTEGRIREFVEERLRRQQVSRPKEFSVLSWGVPIQRGGLVIDEVEPSWAGPGRLTVSWASGDDGKTEQLIVKTEGVKSWSIADPSIAHPSIVSMKSLNLARLPTFSRALLQRRDATCILRTARFISIFAPPILAHRIAHSLLLYHGIDSVIARDCADIELSGNVIHCEVDAKLSPKRMQFRTHQDGTRIVLSLKASDDANLSRLVRLIPWRVGTGVPACMSIDCARSPNIIEKASNIDIRV